MDSKYEASFKNICKANAAIWQKCMELSMQSLESKVSIVSKDIEDLNNFFSNNVNKLQHELFLGQIKLNEYYKLRFLNLNPVEIYPAKVKDNRFKGAEWQENIFFNYIKQSYLLLHDVILKVLKEDEAPQKYKDRLRFTINFLFHAHAPSNFLITNPEIIKKTIETSGANLVQGYANFIRDIQVSNKYLNIQNSNQTSFELGKDLAITKGKVIYKNDLFELIEYYPVNGEEHEIPLLIVPPCINKYYILDLQEKNSLVLWYLKQGYKIYLVSWSNPEFGSAFSLDSYITSGIITALNIIKDISAVKKVNLLGYCIGGTLSLCAAALLRKKGESFINSVILLTALADFSDVGDIAYFINENNIDSICDYMKQNGGFSGEDMSMIFNSLKPSETIWNNYINSYFLGKELSSFDILFWNADTTRLSSEMHEKYLKEFYINNKFVKEGIVIDGVLINIDDLKEDFYIVATIEDHIVPWRSVFNGLSKLANKQNIEFTLGDSGHVAGIINSPDSLKYCYWKNPNTLGITADKWFEDAIKMPGSWWVDLNKWLANKSGIKVNSSVSKLKEITNAPGSYVLRK